MPVTGLLEGIMDVANFARNQQIAQAGVALSNAQTEEAKVLVQKNQMELQQQKATQDALRQFVAQGLQNQAQQTPGRPNQSVAFQTSPQSQQLNAVGDFLMSKGLVQQGMAYKKEAADLSSKEARARYETEKVDKDIRTEESGMWASVNEKTTPEQYKQIAQQVQDLTGRLPDWYTGQINQDLPYAQQAARASISAKDQQQAKGQKGLTATAQLNAAMALNGRAQREVDKIVDTRSKLSIVRKLAEIGTPAGDKQLQTILPDLFRGTRQSAYLFKENSNFGTLYNRLENTLSKWYTGTISDTDRKDVANMIDQMDNTVLGPQIETVRNHYRNIAKKIPGVDPDLVDPVDRSEIEKQITPKTSNGIPTVHSDADYNALPSGTIFTDPQGNKRRKP